MKIVITGATSFLGQCLAQALIMAKGGIDFTELYLIDVVPPRRPSTDPRIRCQVADLAAPGTLESLFYQPADWLFHLASVGYQQTEADMTFGFKVNFEVTRQLLEICRQMYKPCRLIFTSSICVSSKQAIDSQTLQPTSSFGCQKALSELLIQDYARRKLIDVRILRLPLLRIEPPRLEPSISGLIGVLLSALLVGQSVDWPIDPALPLWLANPQTLVKQILQAAQLPMDQKMPGRPLTLPGLAVTSTALIEACQAWLSFDPASKVSYRLDSALNNLLYQQPINFNCQPSLTLGFPIDNSPSALLSALLPQ
ncbi:MAG: NAD-dependent epimerase/dehydratase family protein [Candidatus Symbiodolus clandestinus]